MKQRNARDAALAMLLAGCLSGAGGCAQILGIDDTRLGPDASSPTPDAPVVAFDALSPAKDASMGDEPVVDASEPDALVDALGTPDANNTIMLGWPDPFTQASTTIDNDLLVGFSIEVGDGQAGELVGWGVKALTAPGGTLVRMALYSDTSGEPDMLLSESGVWNLDDELLPTSDFYLNEGSYWLFLSVSNMIEIGQSNASPAESLECYRILFFTTELPDTWNSGSCFTTNPINIFIQIAQ